MQPTRPNPIINVVNFMVVIVARFFIFLTTLQKIQRPKQLFTRFSYDPRMNTPPPLAQAAAPLTVRVLEVDLAQGFARHWHAGGVFQTQFFNALSMSFPVGEQFFIDAVRDALPLLPAPPAHAALRVAVTGFIGQEATHRRIHNLYNKQLDQQGLVNTWQHRATARIAQLKNANPRHALAVTCAYEHFTAVLADGSLRYGSWLDQADPRMKTVWHWHASEETEHRAITFDLYQAVGGSYSWRVRWFALVAVLFALDCARQTARNLWDDGTLWHPRTWWQGLCFLGGREGMVRKCTLPLLAYLRRDFHPSQETHTPSAQTLADHWLQQHADQWRAVR